MKQIVNIIILVALGIISNGCGGGGGGDSLPAALVKIKLETVLTDLNSPISIAFAPDGALFFTELHSGQVRVFKNGSLLPTPFVTVPAATSGNEGLLGITFDPNFSANHFVYLFYTHATSLTGRVVRFTETNLQGSNEVILLDGIPSGGHDGGRLAFGSDQLLYISTGDAGIPALAQNTQSLAGKILRINTNGTIPSSNPDPESPIFASGFRNPFGMAFHPSAHSLYVSDNGPNCDDEINRVTIGANFGWREGQSCSDNDPAFSLPLITFNPSIAPTGVNFYHGAVFPEFEGHLLLTSFNDSALRRIAVDDENNGAPLEEEILASGFGSPIDVAVGPDGFIYVATLSTIIRIVRDEN